MGKLIIATLLLLLLAGCSGGSAPPVANPDPDPIAVDPGPALVQIEGRFNMNLNLQIPRYHLYFLGLRRLSDGWIVKSTAIEERGFIDFDYTDLYFDTYRLELVSYNPTLPALELHTDWQGPVLTPTLAQPRLLELDVTTDSALGDNFVGYDIVLNGDEPAIDDMQYIFTGFRRLDAPDSQLYQFFPHQWVAVFPFIVGPWEDFHLDFNNDDRDPDLLTGIPAGDYVVGVYGIDPAKAKELIVYGESIEAFTAVPDAPTTGVEVHVDFQHAVIRQLP